MLSPDEFQKLVFMAEVGVDWMVENGYPENGFWLHSVAYIEDDWIVTFYSDYGSAEYLHLTMEQDKHGFYHVKGRAYGISLTEG